MKRLLFIVLCFLLFIGCSQSKSELFSLTDTFVKSLETDFDSYGMLGGQKYAKTTSDGFYTVMPVGRLINVKINKAVTNKEYADLKDDFKSHYKNDKRVNDIYLNNGGTIMIDCRK